MFIIGKDNSNKLAMIDPNGDQTIIDDNRSFIQWVQTYSKKIVAITFFIFIVVEVLSLIMVLGEYIKVGDSMHLDILISEGNQTFREVIGGYLIKAAMENVSKGFSGIMDKYFEYKKDILDYNKDNDTGPLMEDGEESDL